MDGPIIVRPISYESSRWPEQLVFICETAGWRGRPVGKPVAIDFPSRRRDPQLKEDSHKKARKELSSHGLKEENRRWTQINTDKVGFPEDGLLSIVYDTLDVNLSSRPI